MKSVTPCDHIPFVHSEQDCRILRSSYADSTAVRVPLQTYSNLAPLLPDQMRRWIDPETDGLHRPSVTPEFDKYMKRFVGSDQIADVAFQKKPIRATVQRFVNSILDACNAANPDWISVPQLPLTSDSGRSKINRELALAARQWSTERHFRGSFILPAIFTNQAQLNLKTARNPKIALIKRCFELSGAGGLWVVDSSLMDQDGSRTLEQTRFPGLISFHQELLDSVPNSSMVVAGPYWGINLVLWAKGLVRSPAVGLGSRYQYHLAGGGGLIKQAKTRIALDCLKRLAVASQDLQRWLIASAKRIPVTDPAHQELMALHSQFSVLMLGTTNRDQIARVYKKWFDSLASVPPAGRALALYQQLSSAYVLGRSLSELPGEDSARRPERIAQQLMLVSL